jgi:hypothetical protein
VIIIKVKCIYLILKYLMNIKYIFPMGIKNIYYTLTKKYFWISDFGFWDSGSLAPWFPGSLAPLLFFGFLISGSLAPLLFFDF